MKRKWVNKDVTVLGLSKSGISAAKYLASKGANCTISEMREQTPQDDAQIVELNSLGIEVEMGGHSEEVIKNSYLIVRSPGIPPRASVFALIKEHNIDMISEIELAYLESLSPFIAITGTNGKTTTTKLVSEILTAAGYEAPPCGNIGVPPTSLLDKKIDYFVAEVSSFQIDTSKNFKPQIACYINYTPDHIDWHGNEEEYFKAKASLFKAAKAPTWAVLNACDERIAALGQNTTSVVYYFGREYTNAPCVFQRDNKIVYKQNGVCQDVVDLSQIKLFGDHNYQNIMAAVAIAKVIGIDNSVLSSVISDFTPPEHRIEYVATIDGIKFYNDSKATNCDSTICALKAFKDEKIVLIAGGKDKGTDLSEFVQEVKAHAASVVLIGQATERFNEALVTGGHQNIHLASSLEEAIDKSFDLKQGPVLLSPACASFDMFKNYEVRGQVFKDYVKEKQTGKA